MTTYTQLVQDVRDTVKDSQVTDAIARDFIAKAEWRIWRDLINDRLGAGIPRQMLQSGKTSTDTFKAIQLPENYLKTRVVKLNGLLMEYVAPTFLVQQNSGQEGIQVEHFYYEHPNPLSVSLPDNWLLKDAYDVYLWASCLQYEPFGHEDQPQFRRWYGEAVSAVKAAYAPQPRGRYFNKQKGPAQGYYSIVGEQMRFV